MPLIRNAKRTAAERRGKGRICRSAGNKKTGDVAHGEN